MLTPTCDLSSNYLTLTTLPNGTLTGVCTPLTTCTLGVTYATTPPERFVNRVCSPVSTCWTSATDMAGGYVSVPATLEDDLICTPLRPPCYTYSTPHYESLAPTPTSDRSCAVQPTCTVPFTYEVVAPTNTSARVCVPTTSCGSNLVQSVAPTAITDRVCTACPAGQIVSGGSCVAASSCPGGSQFQVAPPMGSGQTVCAAATQCSSTQYQVAAATATSDAVCVANVICGMGTLPQGSTTPTTCAATCTPCAANQAMVGIADGCPNCVTLQTSGVSQAAILSQGGALTLQVCQLVFL